MSRFHSSLPVFSAITQSRVATCLQVALQVVRREAELGSSTTPDPAPPGVPEQESVTPGSLGEVLVDPTAAGADADMAERILDECAGQGLEAFPESGGGEEGATSEVSRAC